MPISSGSALTTIVPYYRYDIYTITGQYYNIHMDRLEEIFRMQRDLAEMMPSGRYPQDQEERLSALCTAIMHEAVELQRLTNWKWWKKEAPLDMDDAREELIDVWHFVIQASMELDMTPDDILNEYAKKNAINRNRQLTGY